MTRIVPPIPGLTYVPIDDTGMVLTDPLGIVDTWSIEDGVLTVTTNAVNGAFWLLRPIASYPSNALFNCRVFMERVGTPSVDRVSCAWGVGGDPAVTPDQFIGAGLALQNDANVDRAYVSVNNANNWSGFIGQRFGATGIVTLPAPNGNSTTGVGAATSGGQLNVGEEATGWARSESTDVWAAEVEGVRLFTEIASVVTASFRIGYRYEYTSYDGGAITSGPPPALDKLNPIGPLTLSAGWTLSDPSGIIATAPVSDGSTVTVGFNAIAGIAYLTRPLTSPDIDAVLTVTSMQRVNLPATATFNMGYGTGSVDGAIHNLSGMQTNPTGVVSRAWRNNAVVGNGAGSGHHGIIGQSWMPVSDPTSDGVAKWTGQTTAIRRSGASGNLSRSNGPQVIEAGSRYEVIRFENLDGLAAETMAWTFLSGIANFAYLPIV